MTTISKLLNEFPDTSKQEIMDWLYKVFECWQKDISGEINTNRHQIAGRVGSAARLVPDFSMDPLRSIKPGDHQAIDPILR